jgi:ribosome-associated protein
MASAEVNQMLAVAAAACEDKKAEDIRILALDPTESGLTDYFLICTGMSDRQNVAITDEIEIQLKRQFGVYPNSVEGRRQGEWILMDYVDFIVHVFSVEKRAYYGLERLRKSATLLSVADLNAEIKAAISAKRPTVAKTAAAKPKKSISKKSAAVAKKLSPKKAAKKRTAVKATRPPAKKSVPAKKKTARRSRG